MKAVFIISLLASINAVGQRAASYISKGNEHYLELEFDLAEAQYRRALEVDPKNDEARYNLANSLMMQKKYKAAIEMYDGIRSSNEKLKAASHYNAGVSYTRQKDLPNSIEEYKNALRLNPGDKEARENLQKALSELKKQQDQKDKDDKKKGGGMNENDADKKLKELQQKEKDLQKKLQQGQGKGQGGGKDW